MQTTIKSVEDLTDVLAGGTYTLSVTDMMGIHSFEDTFEITGAVSIEADGMVTKEVVEIQVYISDAVTVSGMGALTLFGADITASLGTDQLYRLIYINNHWIVTEIEILPIVT